MSESKHTPGPWEVHNFNTGRLRILARIVRNGNPIGKGIIANMDQEITDVSLAESTANAALIAASPELLEALRNSITLLELEGYNTAGFRRVIAKAEGGM